jgi:hypothetical protein
VPVPPGDPVSCGRTAQRLRERCSWFVLTLPQPSSPAARRERAKLALQINSSYLPGRMGRDERSEAMLKMASELASRGHRLSMIEAMLKANRFHEAEVFLFLEQPHIQNELLEIADRARRREQKA